MKRVWIAIAILVSLPLLMGLSALYTNHITREMEPMIAAAKQNGDAGRLDEAKENIEEFKKVWNRRREVLETYTRHAELDTLSIEASRLLPYLEKTDPDGRPSADFDACCEAVLFQLRHLRTIEKLSWPNLL